MGTINLIAIERDVLEEPPVEEVRPTRETSKESELSELLDFSVRNMFMMFGGIKHHWETPAEGRKAPRGKEEVVFFVGIEEASRDVVNSKTGP